MRRAQPEHAEQRAFVAWCRMSEGKYPGISMIHASANGAHLAGTPNQRAAQVARMKQTGFSSGIPDLFLPVARGGCHGLFIEMKVAKGRASVEQKAWLARLNAQGYMAVVAYGHQDAIRYVQEYYRGSQHDHGTI